LIDAAAIQKEKCHYGGCEHTTETIEYDIHEEGLCWKITRPELEKTDTDKKYCPCKREAGLIRRYARTGFMEAASDDIMIQKTCPICHLVLLIRSDEDLCNSCKDFQRYI